MASIMQQEYQRAQEQEQLKEVERHQQVAQYQQTLHKQLEEQVSYKIITMMV